MNAKASPYSSSHCEIASHSPFIKKRAIQIIAFSEIRDQCSLLSDCEYRAEA